MRKFYILLIPFLIFCMSSELMSQISYNNFVASVMNQVNADSVYKFERQLSVIHPV
ncbi:MAG: hypothetical protein R3A12_08120 [Ignavibacteria bacterium]